MSDELKIALNAAHDRRLSFGARGLLLLLASPPVPSALARECLANASPEGFGEVLTFLRELAFLGYLKTSDELLSGTAADLDLYCFLFHIQTPNTEA